MTEDYSECDCASGRDFSSSRWRRFCLSVLFCLLSSVPRAESIEIDDSFEDHQTAGAVAGSTTKDGEARRVVDPEGLLSVERGTLRLPPVKGNRWGRMGVSYGPFSAHAGLAFAARIHLGDLMNWDPASPARFTVGFFTSTNPTTFTPRDAGMVVRRSGRLDRGALGLVGAMDLPPMLDPLPQVEIDMIGILRDDSVMFYASGPQGSPGLAPYPFMTPLALIPLRTREELFAGIHQRFQRDSDHPTCVENFRVSEIQELQSWSGTALFADEGELNPADGIEKKQPAVAKPLDPNSPVISSGGNRSLSELPAPAGLISVKLKVIGTEGGAALIFRGRDGFHHWRLELSAKGLRLVRALGRDERVVAFDDQHPLAQGTRHRVWLTDDGEQIRVWLDQEAVLSVRDLALSDGRSVGYAVNADTSIELNRFEAHLRQVPIPEGLSFGAPFSGQGQETQIADTFAGDPQLLEDHEASNGSRWAPQADARGKLHLSGNGFAVASEENTNVVAYLQAWEHPEFADVSVEIVPPDGATGAYPALLLWQDSTNHLVAGLDVGANQCGIWSIRGGRAIPVGVNLPRRIAPGAHRLGASCDGDHVALWLDRERVLDVRLADLFPDQPALKIQKVGIALTTGPDSGDQGTRFGKFEVRWPSLENAVAPVVRARIAARSNSASPKAVARPAKPTWSSPKEAAALQRLQSAKEPSTRSQNPQPLSGVSPVRPKPLNAEKISPAVLVAAPEGPKSEAKVPDKKDGLNSKDPSKTLPALPPEPTLTTSTSTNLPPKLKSPASRFESDQPRLSPNPGGL